MKQPKGVWGDNSVAHPKVITLIHMWLQLLSKFGYTCEIPEHSALANCKLKANFSSGRTLKMKKWLNRGPCSIITNDFTILVLGHQHQNVV